jgi:hypothetical protein
MIKKPFGENGGQACIHAFRFLIISPEPSLVHRSQIILVQNRNLTAEASRLEKKSFLSDTRREE